MRGKKKTYVYLAGNISSDVRTYEWREKFVELMQKEITNEDIVVVDPTANMFNQSLKGYGNGNNGSFVKEARRRSQRILRAKDFQLIKMCNLMVVNLDLYSVDKPLIGTVQELCWARDIFNIPVLAIVGDSSNVYCNHPWLDECCSAKVPTIEEVVGLVKEFFLLY